MNDHENEMEQELLPIQEHTSPTGPWAAVGWVVLFILLFITPAIIIAAYRAAL